MNVHPFPGRATRRGTPPLHGARVCPVLSLGVLLLGAACSGAGGDGAADAASHGALDAAPTRDAGPPHDSGPPRVTACDALPAPGAWERVSPPATDYTTQVDGRCNGFGNQTDAIAINPRDPAMMYVGTNCQGIWRTDDCGAHWVRVNDGVNGSEIDRGAPTSLLIDPTNPDVLWVVDIYDTGLWKSVNGGHDWTKPFPSDIRSAFVFGFIGAIAMDPTNSDHLIVAPHGACSDAFGGACLAETMNGGNTWRVVPTKGAWNEGSGPFVINETTWGVAAGGGLSLTTDSGATWNIVSPQGVHVRGVVHRSDAGKFYVAVDSHGILASEDGVHWTMPSDVPMCVPVVSAGDRIVCGYQWGRQYYYSAAANDLTHWDRFAFPAGGPDDTGAVFMGYDPVHRLIYTSEFRGGLWRMVME